MNKVTIREQLLTSLSLSGAGYYPREKLLDVACSHPGCEDRELVSKELNTLIKQSLVIQRDGLIYAVPTEQDLSAYFEAADLYKKEMRRRNQLTTRLSAWFMRLICKFWHKCFGEILLIVAILGLTIGLSAVDVPDSGYWTTAEVSAYCPCSICCGTHDKTTANNTNTDAVPYAFASDRSLPFGTRVYVPAGLDVLDVVRAEDRWFQVDDRGGALDTEANSHGTLRLDLRVRDHWWAKAFGRRFIAVFIGDKK